MHLRFYTSCVILALAALTASPAHGLSPTSERIHGLFEDGQLDQAIAMILENLDTPANAHDPAFLNLAADVYVQYAERNTSDADPAEVYMIAIGLYHAAVEHAESESGELAHAEGRLGGLLDQFMQKVQEAHSEERFDDVLVLIDLAIAIAPDQVEPYFVKYAILEALGETAQLRQLLRDMVEVRLPIPVIYATSAMMDNDEDGEGTQAALAQVRVGRELFPYDLNLMGQEIKYLLALEETEEDTEEVAELIYQFATAAEEADDPAGLEFIWFQVGGFYSLIGEWDKAEQALLRAIEIDPNQMEARQAIMGLYFKNANEQKQLAFNTNDQEQSRQAEARSNAWLERALEQGEYMLEHEYYDRYALLGLRQVYGLAGDLDGVARINRLIEDLDYE